VEGNVGTPGAAILQMSLLVEAATGKVVVHGRITQSVANQQTIDINNIKREITNSGSARRAASWT
jgi:hypothetical protein